MPTAGAEIAAPWTAERFGLQLVDEPGGAVGLADLAQVGLRRNPKRAQLIVSTVLGKHVPAAPDVVLGAARRLGALVADAVGTEPVVVVGFAETATALAQTVADVLGAQHVCSTRRPTGARSVTSFEESHSHATAHRLAPDDPGLLTATGTVVLVDDEQSTGATAAQVIARLEALRSGRRYVLAALVDLRPAGLRALGAGIRVETVALGVGRLDAPADLLERTAALRAAPAIDVARGGAARVVRLGDAWPAGVRAGAARGFTRAHAAALEAAARRAAGAVARVAIGPSVHVLGTEELMYAPQRIAEALVALRSDLAMTTSSTTRSPAVVADRPGSPIRTGIRFAAHDDPLDGPGDRFAYNLPTGGTIVVVVDEAADTAELVGEGGLVPALTALADLVVVLPIREDTA